MRTPSHLRSGFEALESDSKLSGEVLDRRLFGSLGRLPFLHPEDLNPDFPERVSERLRRRAAVGADCGQLSNLLISILRERPDLRRTLDWADLRHALLDGRSGEDLREENAIAVANLIPYTPSWVSAGMIDLFLNGLSKKKEEYLKPRSRSYFGGNLKLLSACAVYGRDRRQTDRILARLLELLQDAELPMAARSEAVQAMETIYWNQPDRVDAKLMATIRKVLSRSRDGYSGWNRKRILQLLCLSCELRPKLITEKDLAVIVALMDSPVSPKRQGLQEALFTLATRGSDAIYREIDDLLTSQMEDAKSGKDIASKNVAYTTGRLLERIYCTRSGISFCD